MFNYYDIDRETGQKIDFSPKSGSWKTASTPVSKVSFKMPNNSHAFKFEELNTAWCIVDKDMKVTHLDIEAASLLKRKSFFDVIAVAAYEKGYDQAIIDMQTFAKYSR